MKGVIRWFSRNHVAGNFLMLAILLAGFYTWFQLKKEIFPEISIDAVSVGVPYPNASPEDVEEGGLAGTGRPHDGRVTAFLDLEVESPQGWNLHGAQIIYLFEIAKLDDVVRSHLSLNQWVL